MRLLYTPLLLIILTIILASCRSAIMTEMNAAEAFMDEHPDSALLILSGMTELGKDRDIARHALLMSIAQDRNFLTPGNDSLIDIARSFYALSLIHISTQIKHS